MTLQRMRFESHPNSEEREKLAPPTKMVAFQFWNGRQMQRWFASSDIMANYVHHLARNGEGTGMCGEELVIGKSEGGCVSRCGLSVCVICVGIECVEVY